jgi:hypothetical protein
MSDAGLFGNEDRSPTPELVGQHEAELNRFGKTMSLSLRRRWTWHL